VAGNLEKPKRICLSIKGFVLRLHFFNAKSLFYAALAYIFIAVSSFASEHRPLDDFPTPQFVWPDTNFTNVTFGFPSSPTSQVLANGHLYVAFGAYLECCYWECLDNFTFYIWCFGNSSRVDSDCDSRNI
jgi:hypothetical protein